MPNLTWYQAAAPTVVVDDDNGNKIKPNSDGSVPSDITKIGGSALSKGQTTMTGAIPVVLASDQSNHPVKLQDGAGTAITSQANGSARAIDVGIDVSGVQVDPRVMVDGTTPTQRAKIDSQGRQWVYFPPPQGNITIQLSYSSPTSIPIAADEWQDVASYTVPTGYDLSLVQFFSISSQNADDFRAVDRTAFGSYNSATNTFTDGSADAPPAFSAELYVYITTLTGNVADDTVTITYTNHLGVTGRTATILIKKQTIVGTRLRVNLQAGDIGVIDVTNVTHTSTGQAGAWNIEGTTNLVRQNSGAANISEQSVFAVNSSVVVQGETLIMQYKTTAGGAKVRTTVLIASLVPRS